MQHALGPSGELRDCWVLKGHIQDEGLEVHLINSISTQ